MVEKLKKIIRKIYRIIWELWSQLIITRIKLLKNRSKRKRFLEIGPGNNRILEFETLNITPKYNVDYVRDCSKRLPFSTCTFDIVYSSHVLEHIPWYQVEKVLREWVRILKPGGYLELWVPDAVKICKAFVDAEVEGNSYIDLDGWYKFNPEKDPCVWASGRIFTYGDGSGDLKSPNWHRSLFSYRYLSLLMNKAGLIHIRKMEAEDIRGNDHGWINLGIKGKKP
jgi:SAM-dependent methyltransferase